MKHTRACSEVLFGPLKPEEGIKFTTKSYNDVKWFPCVIYRSKKNKIDKKTIWRMLIEQERALERIRYPLREEKRAKPKKSWLEKINERRELAAFYIRQLQKPTIAEVCRMSGCGRKLVRDVMQDLMAFGNPLPFDYANIKDPELVQELDRTIDEVRGTFTTITDIKRQHKEFSRKWIGRRLRGSGYKWLKMVRRKRNDPEPDRNRSTRVKGVVKHLAQANSDPTVMSIYIDEVHFMLEQTATHNWRSKEQAEDEMVYNRRDYPEKAKLTAIAACTTKKFLAIQVFKQDINAEEFLYFLQAVIASIPKGQKVSILVDNATCHASEKVRKAKAGKFLFMNSPKLFRANAIENAFSFVKAEWRKRAEVDTLEEEAMHLVRIFFDPVNEKRFLGIAFNHARSLVGLFKLNFGDLGEVSEGEMSSEEESMDESRNKKSRDRSAMMREGSQSSRADISEEGSFGMDVE